MDEPVTAAPPSASGPHTSRRGSIALAAVAVLLAAGVGGYMKLSSEIESLRESQRQMGAELAGMRKSAIVDLAGVPWRGGRDAVVTLLEYSDYECPFCIRHFAVTMPQIDKEYIQTGKIRYAFRDNPVDQLHPQAIRAHEAARCAGDQGKYWEMHGRLFTGAGTHADDTLIGHAAALGLPAADFQRCLESGRHTEDIRRTAAEAASFGANGTPAFFLGVRDPATDQIRLTRAITGAQPYEVFAQAIDALLKQQDSTR
jgi:protein-disulfide isomerase